MILDISFSFEIDIERITLLRTPIIFIPRRISLLAMNSSIEAL